MPSFNMAQLPAGMLPPVTDDHGNRYNASPVARRLAAGWGIPLQAIHGTGPLGRIIKRDVEAAYMLRGSMGGAGAATPLPQHIVQLPAPELAGEYDLIKHTPMRKSIAQRLTYSKQAVPHFYLDAEVDMDATLARRKKLNETGSIKLTVNDFIVAACAKALADYPAANASWTDEGMANYKAVDISIAVSIEGGLITPIVKSADKKSLTSLSTEVKQLAEDARAGKLKPAQYQGGNFSISNLGMYGITHFQAIINPPQSAILAVGKAEPRVVATEDGKTKIANRMSISLAVDHRVIDGALGAELLMRIKQYLEQPEKLA
jgi:pyruvate dehydrogenase E2 component (dihydrolipoamide acetyltransferase)